MQALWQLLFRLIMLSATVVFAFLAYGAVVEWKNSIAAWICAILAAVALYRTVCGPRKKITATSTDRRRKALVKFSNFSDAQMELYERAQASPRPDGPPTKAQITLAETIGVMIPQHVTAGTAMEIIDDAIDF